MTYDIVGGKNPDEASFSGSILKANMEVEAAIQMVHDLDETGMPCVCIGVGLLGVLLDLPKEGLKNCAVFAHQIKSVHSVHVRYLQTLNTRVKCA